MSTKKERREKYGLTGWIRDSDITALQLEENDKNREWQERMFNQYESPTAQVNMRLAAGLNPSEGVTTQSMGNASTQSISGRSTADSALSVMGALKELPTAILGLAQQRATINKTKDESRLIREEVTTKQYDNFIKSIEANGYPAAYQLQMSNLSEEVRGKRLSNDQADAERKLYQAAYFDDDGNVVLNPLVFDARIKSDDAYRSGINHSLLKRFGVDVDKLPESVQLDVLPDMVRAVLDPDAAKTLGVTINEKLDNHAEILLQKNRKEAYEFLHVVDEFEQGFDRMLDLLVKLRDSSMEQIVDSIIGKL